mmetsp:Transcript_2331/g.6558  ORF Transcript_2331/g.6558 Transcript_2331/m.6558 type:complete len:320 (-) Transcript_2331:131-1090(-)
MTRNVSSDIEGFVYRGKSSRGIPAITERVVVEEGVTSIPSYARFGNKKFAHLKTIRLAGSVQRIENGSFRGCSPLQRVELASPPSRSKEEKEQSQTVHLREIGNGSFADCPRLEQIASLKTAALLERIGFDAFHRCMSLRRLDLSTAVRVLRIERCTFQDCTSLVSIQLPPNLQILGRCCFSNCKSLNDIQIPKTVTLIGWSAFQGCNQLRSMKFPPALTVLSGQALENCRSLNKIEFQPAAPTVQFALFSNDQQYANTTSLHTLEIPIPAPVQLWPYLLEQFLGEGRLLFRGGVQGANRVSIVLSFFRQHIPRLLEKI